MIPFVYVMCTIDNKQKMPPYFHHCSVLARNEEDAYIKGAQKIWNVNPVPKGYCRNDYVVPIKVLLEI